MSTYKNLMTVCCAAVLALGLAACGGGGSDGPATTAARTAPPPMMLPEVTLASLQEGTEIPAGTHRVTGDADDLTALYDALVAFAPNVPADGYEPGDPAIEVGGLMLMCSARSEENCTLEIDTDAQTITVTGLILVASQGGEFPDDRTEEERIAAVTASALTKETAINAEATQGTDASLGGDGITIGTAEDNYSLDIKRDRDDTTITVTVHGATDADDVTFEKAEDLTSSTNPGQMLTRTHDADADGNVVTEVAIVYTDIEAPTATPFGEVHTLDVNTDTTNDDPAVTNEALNVVTANVAQIMSAGFSTSGAGTLSYPFDNTTTEDMDEAFETRGTYNGAPGTYRCNDTSDCTVTYNAMGEITTVSGTWIFTPDAGAMVDVADANYLHYGAWLQRTTDADGAVTYNEVETFAGSSIAATGSIADLEGIAEYEGGAAGVYVHKTFAQDGTSQATSGHFTADASLTAYFSGGATPADKADTLEGTIDNFVLSGGEANAWEVTLQSDGDPNTDGVQPDADGVMAGTASGGVSGQDGSFTATFHGPAGDTDSDAATPDVVPHTVVGEFNSVFTNGSVAGGFGARKQ